MDVLTILLIGLAVAIIAMVAFVGVQRRRRASGVIATKPGRGRRRRSGGP